MTRERGIGPGRAAARRDVTGARTKKFRWRGVAVLAVPAALVAAAGAAHGQSWPGTSWETATPAEVGMDPAVLAQAHDYAASAGGSGMIVRYGLLVDSWGNLHTQYDIKSTTKSIGAVLLGMAVGDGLVGLDVTARTYFSTLGNPPSSNEDTGWLPLITVRHLAAHSAGFGDPGGFEPLLFEPATAWYYSNCGANWLGDALTLQFGDDLWNVLRLRVLDVVGVPASDFFWRDNWYRPTPLLGIPRRELASGVNASVDALARIAYLCLREGQWDGTTVFPASFVHTMGQPEPSLASLPNLDEARFPGATQHYGLLWWTNGDGTLADVPTDAFWGWGLGDSIMLVIPSLDIVAARAGDAWQPGEFGSDYSYLAPFFGPIAESVVAPSGADDPESVSWGRLRARFR
jgi:CubicO group peptidase (beta-lactamase class C family)